MEEIVINLQKVMEEINGPNLRQVMWWLVMEDINGP
jgi:hypothetical protein